MRLWRHQQDVLTNLVLGHWLLLWDMGTGKTAALIIAGAEVGGRQLWISPAVLIPQTVAEIRRWRPDASVCVIRAGRDTVPSDVDVVIVSYDMMRTVPIWRQLFARQWNSCVCDEGHALGHSSALRTRAFYGARPGSPGALFRKCERVWIATGTPVLSSPDELHPHLSRLFPALMGGYPTKQDFLDRFCIVRHATYGDQVVGGRNIAELRGILRSCASRLTLAEVTDLPPLLSDTVAIEISAADRAAIDATLTPKQSGELRVVLSQIEGGVEAAWQRLNAMLLPLASTRRVIALAKSHAAADIVRAELEGGTDRIVLFGVHRGALHHVASKCRQYSPRLLTGETNAAEREAAVAALNDGSSRLLVASMRVAGFGLNLQAARRAIFLETDWTPAGYDQAVGRVYRAGQTRPVHVSLLACAGSIDARVADVIRRKRKVTEELLGETV